MHRARRAVSLYWPKPPTSSSESGLALAMSSRISFQRPGNPGALYSVTGAPKARSCATAQSAASGDLAHCSVRFW